MAHIPVTPPPVPARGSLDFITQDPLENQALAVRVCARDHYSDRNAMASFLVLPSYDGRCPLRCPANPYAVQRVLSSMSTAERHDNIRRLVVPQRLMEDPDFFRRALINTEHLAILNGLGFNLASAEFCRFWNGQTYGMSERDYFLSSVFWGFMVSGFSFSFLMNALHFQHLSQVSRVRGLLNDLFSSVGDIRGGLSYASYIDLTRIGALLPTLCLIFFSLISAMGFSCFAESTIHNVLWPVAAAFFLSLMQYPYIEHPARGLHDWTILSEESRVAYNTLSRLPPHDPGARDALQEEWNEVRYLMASQEAANPS